MKPTRRQMMKSLAGIAVGVSGTGRAAGKMPLFDGINSRQKQMNSYNNQSMNRNAYVTLPSFCTKYLYANLYELMNRRPRPIILMDTYDYERMWGQIVMERKRSMQMVGMITETLRRQGLIQLINYRELYSAAQQKQKLIQCEKALEGLADHTQQHIAKEAARGFVDHFQQLSYQQSFRKALQNWDHALYRRDQAHSRLQRLENGGGAPKNRATRIAMQYTAALEVRRAADTHLDLNVVGVIGQGEGVGVSALLRESSFSLDDEVARLYPDKPSIEQIRRFNPDATAYERDVLDAITQVAREATGTQNTNWFLLGAQLAVPHFPEVFVESWSQPALATETSELAAETQEILSRLTDRAEDNQPEHLQYDAQAIAEQHGITSQEKMNELSRHLDRAVDLANFTPALRDMADADQYESASIMAAASTVMDPHYRVDEDEIYRQAWKIKRQYGSVSVPPHIVERYSSRGGFREQQRKQRPDWYQSVEQVRA